MTGLSKTLAEQLDYTHGVFHMNLKDVDEAQALLQPPAGNCINWVAGHLMATRCGMLELLGKASPWEKDLRELYKRGSDPIVEADGAHPLAEIVAAFTAAQPELLGALAGASKSRLEGPAPMSTRGRDDETVGGLLTGLVFHEAYHTGQLGLLRRFVGLDGAIA